MNFNNLISSRLGGINFYQTNYYKFEKYSNIKKNFIESNPNIEVLDFGIGEGDDMPSSHILNRLSNESFVYENRVYSDNGIDKFKLSASKHLKDIYSLEIEKPLEMITHVMGAKSALTIIPIALINENDIVITTSPGYQVLSNMSCWLKAKIYSVPLLEENNYLPDLDSIDEQIYEQCKIFIINYPNNPTGAIATKTFYEKLISLALKYNFLIVNDCAYGPFSYKKKPLSIMSMEHSFECAVEIHTLSKAYNMTGMRIGFIVGNEQFIDIFKKVKDNIDSGQYIPIQLAACEAYDNCINYINKLKKKYYLRMKKISSILNKFNIISKLSDGTFYLFVKVPDKFNNADTFTRYLLDKCGIFTIPYDEVGHHVRFSMTFKVNTTEQDFYNELEKRLSKLSKLNQ